MTTRKRIQLSSEIVKNRPSSPPDPIVWSKRKMAAELSVSVKPNARPRIRDLKGYPSNAGYLEWLRRFDAKFIRDDVLLRVTDKTGFIAKVHEQVRIESKKQNALLADLERSYEAVQEYISDLEGNIAKWEKVLNMLPSGQDAQMSRFISETKEAIAEYSKVSATLRPAVPGSKQ